MRQKIAGCDLGKATAKFVRAVLADDGALVVESTQLVRHEGKPLDVFREWYETNGLSSFAALGVTGLYADEVREPAISGLPEDACLQAALPLVPELAGGPLNLVSIGARGYSVLVRNGRGEFSSIESDKCSSGTGETAVKIAGRFGLSIEEADRLALGACEGVAITARCSVFAKSEMTHFGNQGKPADQLFRGYFESLGRYVLALLSRVQVPGPIYLTGGGARISALVSAVGRLAGVPVAVSAGAQLLEAMGAAKIAAGQLLARAATALPRDAGSLIHPKRACIRVLDPASQSSSRVTRMPAWTVQDKLPAGPCVLGLDLGSTGSKAVLTSLSSGEPIFDVYDRTRGNPVEAAGNLLDALLQRGPLDVRAIGVTGSGREAVATVLRALYPDSANRISVINEIVAHATAAIRCDAEGGESLSVVEIGGQDAKFIQIAGGQIVESDMNKACSAGTGSFLEEQAIFYGVTDIAEFGRQAREAIRPPDLGQMCTVFVAEAAAEAHNQGFSIPDIFAGFEYSVVHNYIHRVMGQRTFARRVFFQGKPASSDSLAWALAAVAGRDVTVPPNPGAMGAWGIGLCAVKDLGREALEGAAAFDLTAYRTAQIVGRSVFQCQDPKCATLCHIDKTTVAVGEKRESVLSGGACPKYELASASRPKLPKDAPDAFAEREALLAPYLEARPGDPAVAVVHVGALNGFLPWAVTFLRELGVGVRVCEPGPKSLSRGEERCYAYDACAPVKVAHGVADTDADAVFLPKILDVGEAGGPGGRTCPMEQAMGDMVEQSLSARGRPVEVLKPRLNLRGGLLTPELLRQLRWTAEKLGVDPDLAPAAAWKALQAQRDYDLALLAIGRRTLSYGRSREIPSVAVCGSLHVIHDRHINAGIPGILRQNGVLALPMDCYPVPQDVEVLPRVSWGDARRALRTALAARERGDVFPLYLSSFGCGPASFVEQIFENLMEGYPHTVLETDGHGGQAGYVTRVQSFLHTVRRYGRRPSPASAGRIERLERRPPPPLSEERDSRFLIFALGDGLSEVLASAYRSAGFDAVASGPTSAEALAHGRKDCSGKECVAYQLIWGSFRKHLEENPSEKRTVLLQVQGNGACRNCMFSVKDQISLEHLGLSGKVAVRPVRSEPEFRGAFMSRISLGAVTWDILNQLAAYHRPTEREPGEAGGLFARYRGELLALLERPVPPGLKGFARAQKDAGEIHKLLDRASASFAELGGTPSQNERLRTVLLAGDVYVRLDEFAGDSIVRRLNERGLRVIPEPLCALTEYLAHERTTELAGLPTGLLENRAVRFGMAKVRENLYGRVRKAHPWLPMPDIPAAMDAARPLIDRYPRGEAPLTVGSVLHNWRMGVCDGVAVLGPWGCGPALISESLLRHQRDIPMLFLYNDGSPVDERRLNSFAFRLRSAPSRARPPGWAQAAAG